VHCQNHIEALIPKKCGTITYCYTLVRPGYCPFCLGNDALSATARFTSWIRDHQLWQHVSNHIQRCSWPMSCPHPSCDALLDTQPSLRFHFIDDHGFGRTWPGRARSEPVSTRESNEGEDGVQEWKKRKGKPTDDEDTFQWMPSHPSRRPDPLRSPVPRLLPFLHPSYSAVVVPTNHSLLRLFLVLLTWTASITVPGQMMIAAVPVRGIAATSVDRFVCRHQQRW